MLRLKATPTAGVHQLDKNILDSGLHSKQELCFQHREMSFLLKGIFCLFIWERKLSSKMTFLPN
jgi:uncharacterized protein YhhL (DUF1145 family)